MSAPIAFEAQLVAMGEPSSIDLTSLGYDDMVVLVFVAPVEEARKIAPLFWRNSSLTVEPVKP